MIIFRLHENRLVFTYVLRNIAKVWLWLIVLGYIILPPLATQITQSEVLGNIFRLLVGLAIAFIFVFITEIRFVLRLYRNAFNGKRITYRGGLIALLSKREYVIELER